MNAANPAHHRGRMLLQLDVTWGTVVHHAGSKWCGLSLDVVWKSSNKSSLIGFPPDWHINCEEHAKA